MALEHTPVYTVGIRSKGYTKEEETRLMRLGAEFHRTSRGGLITFHGPGQLVLYPICDVRRISIKQLGVRHFVDKLEQTIIDAATEGFGIKNVGRTANTGKSLETWKHLQLPQNFKIYSKKTILHTFLI